MKLLKWLNFSTENSNWEKPLEKPCKFYWESHMNETDSSWASGWRRLCFSSNVFPSLVLHQRKSSSEDWRPPQSYNLLPWETGRFSLFCNQGPSAMKTENTSFSLNQGSRRSLREAGARLTPSRSPLHVCCSSDLQKTPEQTLKHQKHKDQVCVCVCQKTMLLLCECHIPLHSSFHKLNQRDKLHNGCLILILIHCYTNRTRTCLLHRAG